MKIEYSFRPAIKADVSKVTALVNAAYGHYVERIGRLPGPMICDYNEVIGNERVTVAESHGRIVGVIVLSVNTEGFFISNVAVDPSSRGKGLGKALLEFAEAEAWHAGFDSIYLFTHEKMTENLALYSRIGYVEYDRRSEGDFSLVFMRKPLAGMAGSGNKCVSDTLTYSLHPIGFIRSSLKRREDAPKSAGEGAPDAWLEMNPTISEGLQGIAVGQEIILVTWFHRARRNILKLHPRWDESLPLTGVFATRSPDRPNPLGLHRVRVLQIAVSALRIGPLEAIDGTPVVDLKPVLSGSADS